MNTYDAEETILLDMLLLEIYKNLTRFLRNY